MPSSMPASAAAVTCASMAAGSSTSTRRCVEIRISAGSRPISAQRWWSTSTAAASCSGDPPGWFQCWAQRATARSVRLGPLPPMQMGGWGCCTGLGSHRASCSW